MLSSGMVGEKGMTSSASGVFDSYNDSMLSSEKGVAVVGSSNVDLTYRVPRFPKLGETLSALSYEQHFGGKGANQAFCISKLSSKEPRVVFVSVVGNDSYGIEMKQYYRENHFFNVDKNIHTAQPLHGQGTTSTTTTTTTTDSSTSTNTSGGSGSNNSSTTTSNNIPTGQALIFVENESGNNSIVLIGGSNDLFSIEMVEKSWDDISQCRVVVCQNETPLPTTYYTLKRAKQEGIITIFNVAPALNMLNLPESFSDLPKYVDYLICNESEAPIVIGKNDMSTDFVQQDSLIEGMCREIQEKLNIPNVIITLGEKGCAALYSYQSDSNTSTTTDQERNVEMMTTTTSTTTTTSNDTLQFIHVKGKKVDHVVDTTGAGDAWVGSFAYFISCDIPIPDSMELSNFIASITVQHAGAQLSYNSLSQATILDKL
ncbi:hypothetical protein C9374_005760 [Naegleria lovaniensis]|uniref:Ribokinase n=1 Tax=Naegleria lovaniensis TaxID=51637 RepID=A0AA88GP25_NAELO|nr:uncharacterized protein C9374_005760 [Naegleria lovaniensis]KAG2381968.1 hypothetical protein C9374_005760 [Naegleria lovaniensis]